MAEVNATIDEALENAGSRVLSHLGSRAHKLTKAEVKELTETEPVEGEHRVYDGPYTDEADQRNVWTAYQEEEVEPPPPLTRRDHGGQVPERQK